MIKNRDFFSSGKFPAAVVFVLVCCTFSGCAHFTRQPGLPSGKQVNEATGNYWIARYSEKSGRNYLATFPESEALKNRPVIIFLHSLEERGLSIEKLIDNPEGEGKGLAAYALADGGFPFITVSPLCPNGTGWPFIVDRLDILLEEITDRFQVDESRIFLTGVSMGGMGVWAWAMASPDTFAAAAPISGGIYSPPMKENIDAVVDLPIWAFHDKRDPSIPIKKEEGTIEKLEAAGSPVRYTVTDEGRHYIHTDVFESGGLFEWFLKQ